MAFFCLSAIWPNSRSVKNNNGECSYKTDWNHPEPPGERSESLISIVAPYNDDWIEEEVQSAIYAEDFVGDRMRFEEAEGVI